MNMTNQRRTKSKVKPTLKLEDNLILLRYLYSLIGLNDSSNLKTFRDVPEGLSTDNNNTYMHHALFSRNVTIPPDKLKEYDNNIISYAKRLSKYRERIISLKYFQYMAILLSEIYLDKYFSNPVSLLNELNEFYEQHFPDSYNFFSIKRLNKAVYWMATGSGKTFLMHINLWQFLKYNKGPNKIDFDNIVLITQSNELSNQHFREFSESKIPSEIFQGLSLSYFVQQDEKRQDVKIVDIYKPKSTRRQKRRGHYCGYLFIWLVQPCFRG